MADFVYTARLQNGTIQKGKISAHSKSAAIESLHEKQLQPLVVKQDTQNKGLSMNITLPGSKVKDKDLVIFTRQFSTMIDAGVPILRALSILKIQTNSAVLKKVLEEVEASVQGGSSLSEALAKHPKVFSHIYVSMVQAGETGGILQEVLDRLAAQQEKDAALRSKIRAAMVYPAVIFTVTMVAFYILMTFIVPKIGAILKSISNGKAQLPIYTRALLSLSHILKQPSFILTVVIGLPLFIYFLKRYIKTKNGRYQWDSLLLRIPVVGTIITKTAIARFARIFASLMTAGVSIVSAIDTTAGAIGNAVIEKELLACSKAIQDGSQLSIELEKSKHFPPIVSQMLAVGEETGKTDEIILKVADFYEDEVAEAVGAISSIIEPVMIVVLGAMVGLIAISVFGPITKAETSVSG
ncbi:MAG TPA: type II secretion system F family protein [Candidatus Saccharimonadales bacterium]